MNLILGASPRLYSVRLLRDFLTAEDKEGVFNADHFPLWYKRAAEQVPGTFVYSIPFSTGTAQKPGSQYVPANSCSCTVNVVVRHLCFTRFNEWPSFSKCIIVLQASNSKLDFIQF